MKHHQYQSTVSWTGNRGEGTSGYKNYERSHDISIAGKPVIHGTSDPAFRGDPSKHTPEDFLVCSLSTCHMLWYLHLCAVNGVTVVEYVDHAVGVMEENTDGSGQFIGVTLSPIVTVTSREMADKANALHHDANRMCFIARSVNFAVHHKPQIVIGSRKSASPQNALM